MVTIDGSDSDYFIFMCFSKYDDERVTRMGTVMFIFVIEAEENML